MYFLTTPDKIEHSFDNYVHRYNFEILNLFDPELQLINTKSMINSKFKKLLSELKKAQIRLVLEYKKRDDRKFFHSSAKIIASDLDINEAFKSMH